MIPKYAGHAVLATVAVCVGATLAAILTGCGGAKQNAAEGTYAGQQLACVSDNGTRDAIDACRAGVRAKWGRLPDGGAAEGGAP